MFENELFITITGLNYYFGIKPFQIGTPFILKKEPDNIYDNEAIEVLSPTLGRVGYVANSPYTTVNGTMSAGRIYDKIPQECVAVVQFTTGSKVIARVLPDKRLSIKVEVILTDSEKSEEALALNSDLSKAANSESVILKDLPGEKSGISTDTDAPQTEE
jgi:hypothetical protein